MANASGRNNHVIMIFPPVFMFAVCLLPTTREGLFSRSSTTWAFIRSLRTVLLRLLAVKVMQKERTTPHLSSRSSASAFAGLPWSGRSHHRSDTELWASPCSCCRRTLCGCASWDERGARTGCRTRHTWTDAGDHAGSGYAWWQWSHDGTPCRTYTQNMQILISSTCTLQRICTGQIEDSTSPRAYPGHLTVHCVVGEFERCVGRVENLNRIYLLF